MFLCGNWDTLTLINYGGAIKKYSRNGNLLSKIKGVEAE